VIIPYTFHRVLFVHGFSIRAFPPQSCEHISIANCQCTCSTFWRHYSLVLFYVWNVNTHTGPRRTLGLTLKFYCQLEWVERGLPIWSTHIFQTFSLWFYISHWSSCWFIVESNIVVGYSKSSFIWQLIYRQGRSSGIFPQSPLQLAYGSSGIFLPLSSIAWHLQSSPKGFRVFYLNYLYIWYCWSPRGRSS
jgi:hypothetical protein